MPKYKIRAEETIYAIYETEIDADNKKQAKKIALDTCVYDYKNNEYLLKGSKINKIDILFKKIDKKND